MPGPPVDPAPTQSQLTIDSRVEPESVTLVLHGDIDIGSAAALERGLQSAEAGVARRIVLDLAGLGFVDSSGVHVLMEAQERADAAGHELLVTRVPAQAARVFRLAGLNARVMVESASFPVAADSGRDSLRAGQPARLRVVPDAAPGPERRPFALSATRTR